MSPKLTDPNNCEEEVSDESDKLAAAVWRTRSLEVGRMSFCGMNTVVAAMEFRRLRVEVGFFAVMLAMELRLHEFERKAERDKLAKKKRERERSNLK